MDQRRYNSAKGFCTYMLRNWLQLHLPESEVAKFIYQLDTGFEAFDSLGEKRRQILLLMSKQMGTVSRVQQKGLSGRALATLD